MFSFIAFVVFSILSLLFIKVSTPFAFSFLALSGVSLLAYLISSKKPIIVKLFGLKWDQDDFCRGWLITGMTGSGKTIGAINNLFLQITKNVKNWGGVCIDEKGPFSQSIQKLFNRYDRPDDLIILEVRPEGASKEWTPKHTFNIIDPANLQPSSISKFICDTAASLGQNTDKGFFKTQAQIHIEWSIKGLIELDTVPTISGCYNVLCDDRSLKKMVTNLQSKATPIASQIAQHFEENFFKQPPEQLGGVKQTIFNFLKYFTNPDISEVFCSSKPTFSFSDIDQGKVIAISIPQRYATERRYINTFIKFLYYNHAIRRFDNPSSLKSKNLIVLWADEAQKIVTANEDGMSDYNMVDVIREAKATIIAATQSFISLIPPMGNETKAKIFIANMGNRIILKSPDEESAKIAAETIGKKEVTKHSITKGGQSSSKTVHKEERFIIEPYKFRKLKKFEAIIQHCEKGHKKGKLRPILLQ